MNLAQHVTPKVGESLVGFVMRSAEANHLSSSAVLNETLGRVSRPPEIGDAVRLSQACRCSVAEIAQLFGFQTRREDGVRCWRLASEWITRANFISSRSMNVCCDCLRENPYLPGTWELAFYRTCAHHRTRLLSTCPGYRRPLRWNRPGVCTCSCGQDLRSATCSAGSPATWVTAQLIEHRLDSSFKFAIPPAMSTHIVERLAALSLDGLFKTIWFLGHRIADFNACRVGHGRTRPTDSVGESMIENTFVLLGDWPDSLREGLAVMAKQSLDYSAVRLHQRTFKPLTSYVEDELGDRELAFIRLSYERAIRALWRELGQKSLPKRFDRQLEFDLEE